MKNQPLRVQIYASAADAAFAAQLAGALDVEGFEVVTGDFERMRSDAVVAVWSGASRTSRGLLAAAKAPFDAGVLIPVSFGAVEPPAGFEALRPADLAGWTGEAGDPRWRLVVAEIEGAAGRKTPPVALFPVDAAAQDVGDLHRESEAKTFLATSPPPRPRRGAPALTAVLAFAALALAGGFAMIGGNLDFSSRGGPAARVAENPSQKPSGADGLAAAVVADTARAVPMPADPGDEVSLGEDGQLTEQKPSDPADPSAAATKAPVADAIAALIQEIAPLAGDGEKEPQAASGGEPEGEGDTAPSPGDSGAARGGLFKDCDACPEMAAIAAGRFMMGSPAGEQARQASEGPSTDVGVGRFAIGVREVTFGEWDACAAAGGCAAYKPDAAGWGRGRQPAINVSWNDAQAYVRWLSQTTGRRYRLPTEAEWEYAARAGAATPFSFGSKISSAQANFDGALPYGGAEGRYRGRAIAVGSFQPNAYGLFDMHGNVWEWVEDCWRASLAGRPKDGSAPGGQCSRRVLKGGAWNNGGWRLRAGHRIGKIAALREFDNGFRVARELD